MNDQPLRNMSWPPCAGTDAQNIGSQSPVPRHELSISVRNLSKRYKLYDTPQHRLKEALNLFGKRYHRDFWAVRNVSFDVRKGDAFGIIGRNGSGKSTLLQIICGILQPSSGEVLTNGRVSALLELGAGFNPEFTGRSNVYMNGSLMGLSTEEIDSQMEAIEEFAEIGQFIDQPMKTYSSGMYIRLAFACALNVKPDILIIDEALSVGDVFFQQKCFRAIREIILEGTTCLFVSHDTAAISNICNRVVLLDSGEIAFNGPPEEAVSRYYSKLGTRTVSACSSEIGTGGTVTEHDDLMSPAKIIEHNILNAAANRRHGVRGLELVGACVTDTGNNDSLQVEMMNSLLFYVLVLANEDISRPEVGIQLYDRFGNLVFAAGNAQLRYALPPLLKGQELVVMFDLRFTVQAGEYTFELVLAEPSDEGPNIGYFHDKCSMLGPIVVTVNNDETLPFYGIAQLPLIMNWRRVIKE